jgi:hypothetical protein
MAVLYITEYQDIDGTRQVPREPPIKEQTVAITAGSLPSAAFDFRTTMIRLSSDAICSVLVTPAGAASVTPATATSGRMAANQTEYRGVQGNQIISVITNT